MNDAFISKLKDRIVENSLDIEDVAKKLNVDVQTLENCLNGTIVPTLNFILKAHEVFDMQEDDNESLRNIFAQSYFGTKIPLLSNEDFVKDCTNRVIAYYEIPDLNKYGENNLFALRYTGNSIEDRGIMHDSVLIFHQCTSIDRDGIYAVVKRGRLSIKEATLTENGIRIVSLESRRRIPAIQKSSVASGRLVSCINNY